LGISYPCNAAWRYWALARAGRIQPVLDDLRRRWATMPSVRENLTIQEDWTAATDSGAQWSHSGVVPLYCAHMDVAGIRPLAPGFRRVAIRPQLGDLRDLELTAHTPRGAIEFRAVRVAGQWRVHMDLPAECEGEFRAPSAAPITFRGSREFTMPASG
jgi:hypothetical protein